MPDIPGSFETAILLRSLIEARKQYVLGLAEAPRAFILELQGFPTFTVVAFSGSFGYYAGTMMHAAIWYPPIPDIELGGFTLPDGTPPKPNMMLIRDGFKRAIADIDEAISELRKL